MCCITRTIKSIFSLQNMTSLSPSTRLWSVANRFLSHFQWNSQNMKYYQSESCSFGLIRISLACTWRNIKYLLFWLITAQRLILMDWKSCPPPWFQRWIAEMHQTITSVRNYFLRKVFFIQGSFFSHLDNFRVWMRSWIRSFQTYRVIISVYSLRQLFVHAAFRKYLVSETR